MVKGRRPRLFYATQTAASPPTITVFTSNAESIQPAYERYLANQLREALPLQGTPVRFLFRTRRAGNKKRG
jgi:GTP-binding protein